MADVMTSIDDALKVFLLKDLRNQCRARGLNPGGPREDLVERIKEHMIKTGDYTIVDEFTGELLPSATAEVKLSETPASGLELPEHDKKSGAANNYFRPEGQNVGNFISGRSSSRVLAPPGGRTHVQLG